MGRESEVSALRAALIGFDHSQPLLIVNRFWERAGIVQRSGITVTTRDQNCESRENIGCFISGRLNPPAKSLSVTPPQERAPTSASLNGTHRGETIRLMLSIACGSAGMRWGVMITPEWRDISRFEKLDFWTMGNRALARCADINMVVDSRLIGTTTPGT
jgi:hypothetical protein